MCCYFEYHNFIFGESKAAPHHHKFIFIMHHHGCSKPWLFLLITRNVIFISKPRKNDLEMSTKERNISDESKSQMTIRYPSYAIAYASNIEIFCWNSIHIVYSNAIWNTEKQKKIHCWTVEPAIDSANK